MTTTLTEVEDQLGTVAPFLLASNAIQIQTTVDVRTNSPFIDLYDSGNTNYFTISKENESLVFINQRQPANQDEPEFVFRTYNESDTAYQDVLTLTKGGTASQRTPKATTVSSSPSSLNLGDGNIQNITLSISATINFTNPRPAIYTLRFLQGGTGSYTVTWGATINWKGNTPPSLAGAVGTSSIIFILYDGSEFFGWYEEAFP
jgi:hypothetical protein